MADEVTQAVQTEFEITKGIAVAGKELGSLALRFIRFLIETSKTNKEKRIEEQLNNAGEKTFGEIGQLSKAGPPVALEVDKATFEQFVKEASDKGLHFSIIVDPDPNDNLIPIFVPAEEGAAWGALMKQYSSRKLSEDMDKDKSYDQSIAELTERMSGLDKDSDEYMDCEIQIENFKQAKKDIEEQVEYGKKIISSKDEDVAIPMAEFVRRYKMTEAEVNPEVAAAEYTKGVELGQKMSAKELFQPIRDKSLVPDTNFMFYVPDLGAIVTRKFGLDEKTGLAYSTYFFKTDKGEEFSFSDHNMTTDTWNKQVLPDFFSKSGILEGTMCRAFDNEDKMKRFLAYHHKLVSPAKERIEEALKENKEVFSSAEAKQDVMNLVSEQSKGLASATVTENTMEIICSPDLFTNQNGKLDFKLSDDEHIQFSGTPSADFAGENLFKLTFSEDSKPTFVKYVGEAKTEIPLQLNQAKERMEQALGETVSAAVKHISEAKR